MVEPTGFEHLRSAIAALSQLSYGPCLWGTGCSRAARRGRHENARHIKSLSEATIVRGAPPSKPYVHSSRAGGTVGSNYQGHRPPHNEGR
jgi:hypothetical protein